MKIKTVNQQTTKLNDSENKFADHWQFTWPSNVELLTATPSSIIILVAADALYYQQCALPIDFR